MQQLLEVKGVAISVTEKQLQEPDTRSEFERLLDETMNTRRYEQGDIVKGLVVRVERDGILVDVGSKSEGFVPLKEISNVPVDNIKDVVKDGEELEFYILREENENGQLTLLKESCSSTRMGFARTTKEKRRHHSRQDFRSGQRRRSCRRIWIARIRSGQPIARQGNHAGRIDRHGNPNEDFETDTKRNKLILSQRLAVQEEKAAQREKILSTLAAGQEVTGEVVRIADFGAFIDLGGLDGLLPISRNFLGTRFSPIGCSQSRTSYHHQGAQGRSREGLTSLSA